LCVPQRGHYPDDLVESASSAIGGAIVLDPTLRYSEWNAFKVTEIASYTPWRRPCWWAENILLLASVNRQAGRFEQVEFDGHPSRDGRLVVIRTHLGADHRRAARLPA